MVSSVHVQLLLRVPHVCYQLSGFTCFLWAVEKKKQLLPPQIQCVSSSANALGWLLDLPLDNNYQERSKFSGISNLKVQHRVTRYPWLTRFIVGSWDWRYKSKGQRSKDCGSRLGCGYWRCNVHLHTPVSFHSYGANERVGIEHGFWIFLSRYLCSVLSCRHTS